MPRALQPTGPSHRKVEPSIRPGTCPEICQRLLQCGDTAAPQLVVRDTDIGEQILRYTVADFLFVGDVYRLRQD